MGPVLDLIGQLLNIFYIIFAKKMRSRPNDKLVKITSFPCELLLPNMAMPVPENRKTYNNIRQIKLIMCTGDNYHKLN